MSFIKNINPTGAITDFIAVFRQAGSNRWWITLLALAMTVGTFSIMTGESWKKQRPLPEITYITSWPADRTDAETQAFIVENQKRKEAAEKAQQAVDAELRGLWKSLGRASGIDVEAIDAKANKDRAAEQAAEKAKLEQLTGQKLDR
ncbi:hypothetical protein [Novosphingobium sp. B 225]|uniref:hypothetical protein n=1 Tax=Novosphingobium sp. B 225 TaxID=1961849 RepID=UPI000B4AD8C4|nr:hypothetical protein [Novosphingobium sp. B 225]